jgi:hypothetical protein
MCGVNATVEAGAAGVSRDARVLRLIGVVLPICLLVSPGCRSDARVDVYDGFESPGLSQAWSMEHSLPGAIEIRSDVVRSGRRAAAITLHPGDQIRDEKGTILERAELTEARTLTSVEDKAYSYSFSLFLPRDFPVMPTRLVIAQWKQYCPSGKCSKGNPVLALRYQGGEFRLTLHAGAKTQTLFTTKEEIRGRWLDFAFEIRFSRGDKGRVKASLDGRPIADFTGVTAYSEALGYPPRGRFYFKVGLYRDRTPETMKIYVDEYRKKELPKDSL